VLWSEAVLAEVIVFLWIGQPLIRLVGTRGAAILAASAGVLRWSVASQTNSVIALAVVQPLHGLTFALLHLTCVQLIVQTVPMRLAATAQSFYAFAGGLASATLLFVSGTTYAEFGGAAFLLMASLCVIAVPVAWIGLSQIESTSAA
jgi:PPP family 3-phenylpropionic acid transporter